MNSNSSPEMNVPKYTGLAIATLILCCVPGGILALVYNNKIDGLLIRGQLEEAKRASRTARNWIIASVISGFILLILAVVSGVLKNLM